MVGSCETKISVNNAGLHIHNRIYRFAGRAGAGRHLLVAESIARAASVEPVAVARREADVGGRANDSSVANAAAFLSRTAGDPVVGNGGCGADDARRRRRSTAGGRVGRFVLDAGR